VEGIRNGYIIFVGNVNGDKSDGKIVVRLILEK
jgi:hypothetical protein